MTKKDFFPHIAGLRGLALLFVLLFHLNGTQWANGYLGVDVFLVIMGYLMFKARVDRGGNDTLKQCAGYLMKRVRRIVPPMLVIILATLTIGLFVLSRDDETWSNDLGHAACLLRANIYLKHAFADYFAPDSQFMPLLPLWYLSVALQLCALYAVGNYALQRLSKRILVTLLVLVGLASLLRTFSFTIHEWLANMGCPVWKMRHDISYYDTLPRVWEVMAGGLVLCLPTMEKRRLMPTVLFILGLLLLVIPVAFNISLSLGQPERGVATVMCVVGTVLCIRYCPRNCLRRVLDNQALVRLGSISFSIYLVHMPVFVGWRLITGGNISPWDEGGMLISSVVLGRLFWWSIEKRRFAWWLLALMWMVTTLLTVPSLWKEKSIPAILQEELCLSSRPSYENYRMCYDDQLLQTLPKEMEPWPSFFIINNVRDQKEILNKSPLICIGDPEREKTFLLTGDSHAAHLCAGLDTVFRGSSKAGVYLASRIAPLHNVYEGNWDQGMTPNKAQSFFSWLEMNRQITHVIIAQLWTVRLYETWKGIDAEHAVRSFFLELKKRGIRTIVIAPTPEFRWSHYETLALLWDTKRELTICSLDTYNNRNKRILAFLRRMVAEDLISLVEPVETLAPGESFQALQGSQLLMIDNNHLNALGSKLMAERLYPMILEALSMRTGNNAERPTASPQKKQGKIAGEGDPGQTGTLNL